MTWQLDFSEFNYKLKYWRDKNNKIANVLTRLSTTAPIWTEIRPDEKFFKTVYFLYKDDKNFGFVYNELKEDCYMDKFKFNNKLLYFDSKLCIPRGNYTLRTILLDEAHNKEASHMSVEKTCNLLEWNYYWP